MTAIDLETFNRRTAIAAVRQEAARIGADGDQMLDSSRFYDQVTRLDPDAPGFISQIRAMVGESAGNAAASGSRPAPQAQAQEPRQWTMDDVNALPKTREGGRRLTEAINAGLLTSLGYHPNKKTRR